MSIPLDLNPYVFGLPNSTLLRSLTEMIIKIIDDPDFEEQRLDLHRILYRASWYIKDTQIQNRVIFLFNDLIKTIKTLYDDERNYSKVLDATEIAFNKCKSKSDYETVISYKVRALIHQERWQEAEKEIENLKQYAPPRNIHYLYGFLNRKKKDIPTAIDFYLESRRCGRNDESLNRELGQCYLFVKDYIKANGCVQQALDRQRSKKRSNFYVLDLQIQIAMALRDVELAKNCIIQLQDIDEVSYYFRKSRFEFLFGDKYQAEEDSVKSLKLSKENPRFQFLAQLALCKISIEKLEEAEEILNLIDQKFGSLNLDIRRGLRTRLAIARSRYEDAVLLSNEIVDKSTKSYKGIRRRALQGFLNNCAMSDDKRSKLSNELKTLNIELTSIDEIELTEIDNYLDID
nr:hypothetical protein [Nostoc sp. EkiNYC01]